MGVRLVRYTRTNSGSGGNIANDHDELINRDLMNQHPIYAITGLQEVLNILEDSIFETSQHIVDKEADMDKKLQDFIDKFNNDVDDINQTIVNMLDTISKLNTIEKIEDTYSIDLDYDTGTKTLKGNVKIYEAKDDSNAIIETMDGLYVSKTFTEDTSTVSWTSESRGESLLDIYNEGMRFSHYSNSWNNLYNYNEANAWYWDDNLQSFVQPMNTGYFNGFVTKNFYDDYTHIATLRSTNSDNDLNGLVIGFVFDENGNPHTLTALVDSGGMGTRWAIAYDYYLPDSVIIAGGTVPSGRQSGWSYCPNGITLKVTKFGNMITAECSNWNSVTINSATKITINLDNYAWGIHFKKRVRYGYCNISQASSYFTNIDFKSKNVASSQILFASVKVSEDVDNNIEIRDDGIYSPAFKISNEAGNALTKKTDGYHVEGLEISSEKDNCLTKKTDGLYVREQSNIKQVTQTSHGFVIGDFIYYNPTGSYQKALAIDSYDANIVGMVTKVIDSNSFEYQWSGYFSTDVFDTSKDFVQGMPLYISDVNPGKVTQIQPDISKAVGYPVEDVGIIISIERGIQYNQEASIGDFKTSANDYNIRSDGFIKVTDGVDYKKTLIDKLLQALTDDFKAHYIIEDVEVIRFTNTDELYASNGVPSGINLFIKAF